MSSRRPTSLEKVIGRTAGKIATSKRLERGLKGISETSRVVRDTALVHGGGRFVQGAGVTPIKYMYKQSTNKGGEPQFLENIRDKDARVSSNLKGAGGHAATAAAAHAASVAAQRAARKIHSNRH